MLYAVVENKEKIKILFCSSELNEAELYLSEYKVNQYVETDFFQKNNIKTINDLIEKDEDKSVFIVEYTECAPLSKENYEIFKSSTITLTEKIKEKLNNRELNFSVQELFENIENATLSKEILNEIEVELKEENNFPKNFILAHTVRLFKEKSEMIVRAKTCETISELILDKASELFNEPSEDNFKNRSFLIFVDVMLEKGEFNFLPEALTVNQSFVEEAKNDLKKFLDFMIMIHDKAEFSALNEFFSNVLELEGDFSEKGFEQYFKNPDIFQIAEKYENYMPDVLEKELKDRKNALIEFYEEMARQEQGLMNGN